MRERDGRRPRRLRRGRLAAGWQQLVHALSSPTEKKDTRSPPVATAVR